MGKEVKYKPKSFFIDEYRNTAGNVTFGNPLINHCNFGKLLFKKKSISRTFRMYTFTEHRVPIFFLFSDFSK